MSALTKCADFLFELAEIWMRDISEMHFLQFITAKVEKKFHFYLKRDYMLLRFISIEQNIEPVN